ncbi:MAG: SRPBCC family protein [Actinomycetota bacterium]|nr:SRPBCC family protein [Actinomycetota bacterium]
MPVVHETIVIGRSKQDIWPYLVEPDKLLLWQSGVVSLHGEWEGEPRPGDRANGAIRIAGRRVDFQTEFTVINPPRRVQFKSAKSPFPFVVSVELADADGGTHVTYHGEAESFGGFFGRFADPIVTKLYGRDVKGNLHNLKVLLEEAEATA